MSWHLGEGYESIRGIQVELRKRGEDAVADLLDEFQVLTYDQDDEKEAVLLRLLEEHAYDIPFMFEDAAGTHMIAFRKLTPDQQDAALRRKKAQLLQPKAQTNEEKIGQLFKSFLPPKPSD